MLVGHLYANTMTEACINTEDYFCLRIHLGFFFSPRENPKRIKCEKFESQKERWLSCLAWRLHRQAVLSGNTFQAGKSSSWIFLFFLSLNQQLKSPPSSRAAGTWLWIFTVIPGRVSQEMNPSIRKSVSLPALPCRCSVATGGYPPLYLPRNGREGESRFLIRLWCRPTHIPKLSTSQCSRHKSFHLTERLTSLSNLGKSCRGFHGELMLGY